ncbi:hypothetical protein [Mucilaginibacter auburnensis]|uniref:Uncharacterized protein n=1 Tax=Mucilaginibacter auburnensis TaxID=1457233 RepID=A0A2H9VMD8_9SPHI|nr:hypothetical protein [Mucilaginibacter auburnensis]PJJ79498.1 hypothetical protein CLV57_2632 [Mucilaginibacter auburnensis]
MDQLSKTVLSGGAGTVVMTLGSELMSKIWGENFSEPNHLETMIKRLAPMLSKQAKVIAGWGAHFTMGFVFAAIYVELWEKHEIKHNITNGIILGIVSGLIGLLIWKGTFKVHPLPPWLDYTTFYLQRIPAHVVFAVATTITYRLLKKTEEEKEVKLVPVWNSGQAGTFRRVRALV